jgi:hypothetical protein
MVAGQSYWVYRKYDDTFRFLKIHLSLFRIIWRRTFGAIWRTGSPWECALSEWAKSRRRARGFECRSPILRSF